MDFDKFLANIKFDEQVTHSSIINQSETITIMPNKAIQTNNSMYSFLLWMFVLYVGSWTLFQVFHWSIATLMTTKTRSLFVFSFFQSPCRKCQFFDENNYLNCAVHPSIVLTNQAVNCSDYDDGIQE